MLTPKITPSSSIMIRLALPIAVIAVMPSMWLTKNWYTLAVSDCSTLPPNRGRENMIRVREAVGPTVRRRWLRPPCGPRPWPQGPVTRRPDEILKRKIVSHYASARGSGPRTIQNIVIRPELSHPRPASTPSDADAQGIAWWERPLRIAW